MDIGRIRIGISGWRYAPWRGAFYPRDLPQDQELAYASRAFSSIEINGTFYGLQTPASYAHWYEATPDDFVFSVKGPRFISHVRRLREVEQPLASFFASGVFKLREKLGPILWQFPPSLHFDPKLFESFFAQLPHDTEQALKLARHHKESMAGRVSLSIDAVRPLRHAIEVRHESFVDKRYVALLRRYHLALVVADTAGKWPYCEDLCGDFVYMRLHGDKKLYESGYSEQALKRWARRMRAWRKGKQPADAQLISAKPPPKAAARDIYCFFDNDVKVRAPFDARRLTEMLAAK